MDIGDRQVQIINWIKKYLIRLESTNIDSALSSFCYFTSWAETPGYAKLKLESTGSFFIFKYWNILLKNILAIASHRNYLEFSKQNPNSNHDLIILSWAFKEDFQSDGSFKDRYFNENSKNIPNAYWIVISMDGYIPSNLDNNIKIVKKKEAALKYNIFYLVKILLSLIIEYKFSLKKIFHYSFFNSYFAKKIIQIIKNQLKNNNFKAIILPYEAQPFQNSVFLESKKINKKLMTIGYLHSISPLTSELIYRKGAPDLLLVHGESQVNILKSKLNWPKDKLLLIQSLRFQINDKKILSEKIFIPMSIHNYDRFLSEFKKLVIDSPANGLPKFSVRNHPAVRNSKKHLYLKKELEKIMETHKGKFSDDSLSKNTSIFFGVTSAVLESLEKKINVIHICSDPVFQSYSETIWPDLKVKQLSQFTYQYSLDSLGKHINFGKNNTLNQTLKTIF